MSRNQIVSVAIALLVGLAVGWAVHGRSQVRTIERTGPLAITFSAGHELRIVQSEKPGNSFRLIPFAVKRGEHRDTFGDAPADPLQLWLVTYDDVVISCRSEQAKPQHP